MIVDIRLLQLCLFCVRVLGRCNKQNQIINLLLSYGVLFLPKNWQIILFSPHITKQTSMINTAMDGIIAVDSGFGPGIKSR